MLLKTGNAEFVWHDRLYNPFVLFFFALKAYVDGKVTDRKFENFIYLYTKRAKTHKPESV
jgi:hypothetical protein